MKYLLVLTFIFCSLNCFSQMTRDTEPAAPQYFFTPTQDSLDYTLDVRVYLAKSSKAKTYHFTQGCRALKHHRETIVAVRESVAKQENYHTACRICSK